MAADGSANGYRYTLGVPINATYDKLLVNHLEWWEVDKTGRQKVFTWMRSAMELLRIPDWETMLALMIDPDSVDPRSEPLTG